MPPDSMTFPWTEILSNLGTGGVLAWFLWYLVTRHLPKLEERHREERQELIAALDKKDEQHDRITASFNETVQRSIEVQSTMNSRLEGVEKSIEQLPSRIGERIR